MALPPSDLPKVVCEARRISPLAVIRLMTEPREQAHPFHVDAGSTAMIGAAWTGRVPVVLNGAASGAVVVDLTRAAETAWVRLPPAQ
jgi:siroheme synthase